MYNFFNESIDAFTDGIKHVFKFTGTQTLRKFWLQYLMTIVMVIVITMLILLTNLAGRSHTALLAVIGIVSFIFAFSMLSAEVRRVRDTGLNNLLVLLVILGPSVLLIATQFFAPTIQRPLMAITSIINLVIYCLPTNTFGEHILNTPDNK